MSYTSRASSIAGLLALLVALLPAAPAAAQSDSALRRENDVLRAKVHSLEAELESAQQRISELEKTITTLEAQVQRLTRALSGSKATTELEPEKVTVDESIATASPRALFRAMQESYREHLADQEQGNLSDRDRMLYLRSVERWAASFNREFRQPITWMVRITESSPAQRGIALTVLAVDPETDVELGDSFPVLVTNRALIRRLETMDAAGQLRDQKLELKGVLLPDARLNPNREAEGTFNSPPYIGPFAEFFMGVEAQSIRPAAEVADAPGGGGTTTSEP